MLPDPIRQTRTFTGLAIVLIFLVLQFSRFYLDDTLVVSRSTAAQHQWTVGTDDLARPSGLGTSRTKPWPHPTYNKNLSSPEEAISSSGGGLADTKTLTGQQDPLLGFEVVDRSAENSTLGFSSIRAIVTSSSSWRAEGLRRAANRTGLDIQTILFPNWTDVEADDFRKGRDSSMGRGSAKAWLSHAYAIKQFIASNETSTLILEDDADWDLEIKSQMLAISQNMQEHYRHQRALQEQREPTVRGQPGHQAVTDTTSSSPYGLDEWDIIWLGHCGGIFTYSTLAASTDASVVLRTFFDATLPEPAHLRPQEYQLLPQQARPPQSRTIFFPAAKPAPLCTFAYALTRESAKKLHHLIMESGLKDGAFDVRMQTICRLDWGLKYSSIWPELMHHQQWSRGAAGIGSVITEEDQKMREDQKMKAEGQGNQKGVGEEVDTVSPTGSLFPVHEEISGDISRPAHFDEKLKSSEKLLENDSLGSQGSQGKFHTSTLDTDGIPPATYQVTGVSLQSNVPLPSQDTKSDFSQSEEIFANSIDIEEPKSTHVETENMIADLGRKVTQNIKWSARCNSEKGWQERLQSSEGLISCIGWL